MIRKTISFIIILLHFLIGLGKIEMERYLGLDFIVLGRYFSQNHFYSRERTVLSSSPLEKEGPMAR